MKVTVIPIVVGVLGTVQKVRIEGWKSWKLENETRQSKLQLIVKIGLNTEKSSGDLRRFAVTQTSVKAHQLTLV